MCRSVLLVVCVVTLSHHIQLGNTQFDVNILLRAWLISSLSDIKSNLSSIQTTVNTLEGTVNTLEKDFDQFTSETASHFAEIENHVNQANTQLMGIEEFICDTIGCHTCGGTGGWRRVVYLDMTDPNIECPPGWRLIDYPKRTCGRVTLEGLTCYSVNFPVPGGQYDTVCGTIKGYQINLGNGFKAYNDIGATSIDDAYVEGVSLTHGTPRQHIWTFAVGTTEFYRSIESCPCDTPNSNHIVIMVPPFVGQDYFCESGVNFNSGPNPGGGFHVDDLLWDGERCTSTSSCCEFNNPPYFIKQFSNSTTDDIEARICGTYNFDDTAIEFIELYVK